MGVGWDGTKLGDRARGELHPLGTLCRYGGGGPARRHVGAGTCGGPVGTDDMNRATTRLARNLGSVLVSIIVALALWEGFIRLYHVDPVIAKNPLDVWRYIFTQHADKVHGFRSAAGNRAILFHNLRTTLRDAVLGYVAG